MNLVSVNTEYYTNLFSHAMRTEAIDDECNRKKKWLVRHNGEWNRNKRNPVLHWNGKMNGCLRLKKFEIHLEVQLCEEMRWTRRRKKNGMLLLLLLLLTHGQRVLNLCIDSKEKRSTFLFVHDRIQFCIFRWETNKWVFGKW